MDDLRNLKSLSAKLLSITDHAFDDKPFDIETILSSFATCEEKIFKTLADSKLSLVEKTKLLNQLETVYKNLYEIGTGRLELAQLKAVFPEKTPEKLIKAFKTHAQPNRLKLFPIIAIAKDMEIRCRLQKEVLRNTPNILTKIISKLYFTDQVKDKYEMAWGSISSLQSDKLYKETKQVPFLKFRETLGITYKELAILETEDLQPFKTNQEIQKMLLLGGKMPVSHGVSESITFTKPKKPNSMWQKVSQKMKTVFFKKAVQRYFVTSDIIEMASVGLIAVTALTNSFGHEVRAAMEHPKNAKDFKVLYAFIDQKQAANDYNNLSPELKRQEQEKIDTLKAHVNFLSEVYIDAGMTTDFIAECREKAETLIYNIAVAEDQLNTSVMYLTTCKSLTPKQRYFNISSRQHVFGTQMKGYEKELEAYNNILAVYALHAKRFELQQNVTSLAKSLNF